MLAMLRVMMPYGMRSPMLLVSCVRRGMKSGRMLPMVRGTVRSVLVLEQALGLAQQGAADGQAQGEQTEAGQETMPASHESMHE